MFGSTSRRAVPNCDHNCPPALHCVTGNECESTATPATCCNPTVSQHNLRATVSNGAMSARTPWHHSGPSAMICTHLSTSPALSAVTSNSDPGFTHERAKSSLHPWSDPTIASASWSAAEAATNTAAADSAPARAALSAMTLPDGPAGLGALRSKATTDSEASMMPPHNTNMVDSSSFDNAGGPPKNREVSDAAERSVCTRSRASMPLATWHPPRSITNLGLVSSPSPKKNKRCSAQTTQARLTTPGRNCTTNHPSISGGVGSSLKDRPSTAVTAISRCFTSL
mmetsp:Transcript_43191/g.94062  ORF Transcript_43191/g.94062 Transcript_43191/m.94062 type:complete len:283 (-) Transcript_43191:1284-2132(-)